MINWLAVKEAASPAGYMPSNGVAPTREQLLNQMAPARRRALEANKQKYKEMAVEVPKAYVKGVAQDITNPQAWRDAVESVGTQWNRGFRMMKPMAHLLYKEPISMFGKGVTSFGQKAGWMTPQQAAQQKATWDWWTAPQRQQMEEIRQRFPYAERLQNNPFYTAPASLLEEGIATAGLGAASKALSRVSKATRAAATNKINKLRGKAPTSFTNTEGLAIEGGDSRFQYEMRNKPEYKKLIDKADRSDRIGTSIWNKQQAELEPVSIAQYSRENNIPFRTKWDWADGVIPPNAQTGARIDRTWYDNLSKPTYKISNKVPGDMLWVPEYVPEVHGLRNIQQIKITDDLRHELGHLKDFQNRLGRGPYFGRNNTLVTDLKTIVNPWNNPGVNNEVLADTYAFASPKTGKLSKFAEFRHHPQIQTYLTWEKIAAMERMKQRGKAVAEAATAAAGAYPFLNTDDPSKP